MSAFFCLFFAPETNTFTLYNSPNTAIPCTNFLFAFKTSPSNPQSIPKSSLELRRHQASKLNPRLKKRQASQISASDLLDLIIANSGGSCWEVAATLKDMAVKK
jgi:hypothetical protein